MIDAPSYFFDPASGERRLSARFVQESRFGVWFLGTGIWANHVLKRGLEISTALSRTVDLHTR